MLIRILKGLKHVNTVILAVHFSTRRLANTSKHSTVVIEVAEIGTGLNGGGLMNPDLNG